MTVATACYCTLKTAKLFFLLDKLLTVYILITTITSVPCEVAFKGIATIFGELLRRYLIGP